MQTHGSHNSQLVKESNKDTHDTVEINKYT